jgi:hypothetical protein
MREVAAAVGFLVAHFSLKRPKIKKFPVKFPDNREIPVETGSQMTAHTTIQSSQTARFRRDAK